MRKLSGAPKHLGTDTIPDRIGHFGFSRWCGIAGNEQVPPSPLGWYLIHKIITEAAKHFKDLWINTMGQYHKVAIFIAARCSNFPPFLSTVFLISSRITKKCNFKFVTKCFDFYLVLHINIQISLGRNKWINLVGNMINKISWISKQKRIKIGNKPKAPLSKILNTTYFSLS